MAKQKFYAVQKGKVPGVFLSWDECKASVDGYPGAVYKSFGSYPEAKEFVSGNGYNSKSGGTGASDQSELLPDCAYAFVDGSYNPKTEIAGYGGFLVEPFKALWADRITHVIKGAIEDAEFCKQRNVAGEMTGSLTAVQLAASLGIKELVIFYDYEGIEKWVTGEWKANNEYTRRYAYKMQEYILSGIDIRFVHVKGHSGVPGNEKADSLAKEAVGV